MGIELAKAYISVSADSSSLGPDLENIKRQVESSMAAIQAGALAVMGSFARFGSGTLSAGMGQAEFLEKTTVEMETMLGSAEETQETLAKLTKFAAETPFEMPQLLNLSRELITFGERGDDMMKTLKMLGDVSSGDAMKFGMVGLVFNQVRGAGKLLTQDFRQLSTRGVLSLKDISSYFKVTDAQASKMLSTGKIGFEDFRKILQKSTEEGGRFANGMAKQAQTLGGLRSTMNDNINLLKRFIAEPLLPYMKSVYSAVISVADALGPMVKLGGEAASFAFVGATAFASFGTAVTAAGFALRFFGISLRTAWKGFLLGTGIGAIVVALGAAIGALASYLEIPKKIGNAFQFLYRIISNSEVVKNFRVAWERIKDTAGIIMRRIADFFAPILGVGTRTWSDIATAVEKWLTESLIAVSNFAMEAAEWIQAIAMNWEKVWANMPQFAMVAFRVMNDVFGNVLGMMLDGARNMVREMVAIFIRGFTEIGIMVEKMKLKARGEEMSKFAEDTARKFGATIADKTAKSLPLGKDSGIKDPFKLSDETLKFMKGLPIWKDLVDIFNTKKELEKKRNLITDDPGKGKSKPSEQAATDLLKPGVFQIPELGKKLQEAALKTGGGMEQNIAKMVGIGEQGNKLQEEQLKALQKLNPGLA